jgi:hypothetical protein
MKDTAVQWFASKVLSLNISPKQMHDFIEWFQEAKEIEKGQIKEAFIVGNSAKGLRFGSEKYYNQTYLEK